VWNSGMCWGVGSGRGRGEEEERGCGTDEGRGRGSHTSSFSPKSPPSLHKNGPLYCTGFRRRSRHSPIVSLGQIGREYSVDLHGWEIANAILLCPWRLYQQACSQDERGCLCIASMDTSIL
jgi:hypothetical protein